MDAYLPACENHQNCPAIVVGQFVSLEGLNIAKRGMTSTGKIRPFSEEAIHPTT